MKKNMAISQRFIRRLSAIFFVLSVSMFAENLYARPQKKDDSALRVEALAAVENRLFPAYAPNEVVEGVYRYWLLPNSLEFSKKSQVMAKNLADFCQNTEKTSVTIESLKKDWQQLLLSWENLSSVAIGPVVARRSQRNIDFMPTREAMIQEAIARAPSGESAMEQIGAPAKGLPALEWLIWQNGLTPATPACHYAQQVAQSIQFEADAIQVAVISASQQEWTEEQAAVALSEIANQWLAGLERLRWAQIQKEIEVIKKDKSRALAFPRALSHSTVMAWQAQWQTIERLTVLLTADVPSQSKNLVPIEAYLYGKGQIVLAKQLLQHTLKIRELMQTISDKDIEGLQKIAQSLTQFKSLFEQKILTALHIQVGFSDADGD